GQERLIPRWLEQALAIAKKEKCTLTTTGHSLGGWLAQVTAFIAKDQYPEQHVKAITFDSPGAKPMLEQIKPRNVPLKLDYLDITNYLSSPNLINACNLHVGTVYRIVFERFVNKLGKYTLESHDMANFLQAFDMQTGKALRCVEVKDWPLVSKEILDTAINLAGKGNGIGMDIKSLCYVFVLLKKCLNQELLGEYSGFFKFANETNFYHTASLTLKGEDDFDRKYKYHYQTRPFDPHTVSIRHLPEDVRQLLGQFHNNSLPHAIDDKHRGVIEAVEWQQEKGYVRVASDQDIRCYIDDLVSITTQYASLRQTSPLLVHGTFSISGVLPPPTISLFVGRKNSLRILTQTLNQQKGALIIAPPITGPPGIGKSQLALQVISQQAATQRYDYVFWISAESKHKLLHAYLDLAKGLNIPTEANDPEKIVKNVRQHLRAKHCLYIFDDAPSKKAIEPFLPLQQGHVLVTSHNSSTAEWSQKPISLTPLSQAEALDLAHKFGYRDKDHKVLEKLLAIMPCYPLFLLQLFNIFKYEGISPESFVTATQQSDERGQEGVL
ncbi:MAG: NB-ARC domain-containing protein, partial [Bacteroidota bacterium]